MSQHFSEHYFREIHDYYVKHVIDTKFPASGFIFNWIAELAETHEDDHEALIAIGAVVLKGLLEDL